MLGLTSAVNHEFKLYDCGSSAIHCTTREFELNNELHNEIELGINHREKQLMYFIARVSR